MKATALIAGLLMATPAAAEVVSSTSNGFEVRETASVPVSPADAYAGFGRIASWWSGAHSFSGNPANLTLSLEPGGCFCEKMPKGGGVTHMHVTYVEPAKRVLLTGSLGPLLFLATTGVMDVQFQPSGDGTNVVVDYRVAGFFNGGADRIAPAVDGVLGEQVKRYAASVTR